MTNAGYENLLYELGTELTRDPEIELKRLVYICRKKIPAERREVINDIFALFDELEKYGDLSIDNLGFLKEVLEELSKHDLLEKVAAFEAKPRSSVESPRHGGVAAVQGVNNNVAGLQGGTDERKDEGMFRVICDLHKCST